MCGSSPTVAVTETAVDDADVLHASVTLGPLIGAGTPRTRRHERLPPIDDAPLPGAPAAEPSLQPPVEATSRFIVTPPTARREFVLADVATPVRLPRMSVGYNRRPSDTTLAAPDAAPDIAAPAPSEDAAVVVPRTVVVAEAMAVNALLANAEPVSVDANTASTDAPAQQDLSNEVCVCGAAAAFECSRCSS